MKGYMNEEDVKAHEHWKKFEAAAKVAHEKAKSLSDMIRATMIEREDAGKEDIHGVEAALMAAQSAEGAVWEAWKITTRERKEATPQYHYEKS